MRTVILYVKVLAVALLGGFGVSLVHHNARESFGLGMGAAVLIAAVALYHLWFVKEQTRQ